MDTPLPVQLPLRRSHLLLLAILLVAAGLRFYALDGQSFWADEGNSVVLARQSAAQITAAAAADIHPPAYYLLLSVWGKAFGLGEVGARSFSAGIGVLLVGVMFLLGRRLRGVRTGLLAASLAAVNPFLIYYSQEARMYELLALCAALAAYGLLLASTEPARKKLGAGLYLLAAVLGLYTHYAFPIHLLALNLVYMLWLWRSRQNASSELPLRLPSLLSWLLLNLLASLLFLPWMRIAIRQLTTWPAPPVALGAAAALQQTLTLFLCGPTGCPDIPPLLFLPSAVLSLALVSAAAPRRWQERSGWLETALPLVWLLAPLAAMLAFGIFSPVFFKFLLIAAPAHLLLVATGLDRVTEIGRKEGRTAAATFPPWVSTVRLLATALLALVLVSPGLLALNRYYHDPAVARDDYRSLAAYIKAVADEHDAVILDAPGQIDAFSQYDHGRARLYPLPASRPLDPAETLAALDRIIADSRRIYAIYWATEQSDPEGLIEEYLAGHAYKAWDSWVGHLRFVAYNAEPPPPTVQLLRPVRFGDAILLDALGLRAEALQPGDIAQVLLRWTVDAPVGARYKVTLQLLDPANQVVAQVDSEPVGGARPTTAWQPFAVIDDPYGLPIPLATPPGDYSLILALYDAVTGVRLPVHTAERISDHLPLGTVQIRAPDQEPPLAILPIRYRAETRVGPFTFLGYDRYKQGFGHAPDTPLAPGDALHLTTFWRAERTPAEDVLFEVLFDGIPLGLFHLAGPGYPTSVWTPHLPWRGEHSVILPPERASGGKHDLTLQLVTADGQTIGSPISLKSPLIY